MTVAIGLSEALDPQRGLELAARAARTALEGEPDLAVAFISTAHGCLAPALGRRTRGLGGAAAAAAVQVEGLLGDSGEIVATPAVAVIGCRGLGGALYAFDHGRGREQELGDELLSAFGPFGDEDLLFVVADAHALDARKLAAGLGCCAPATVLGLGVAGPAGGPAVCVVEGESASGGALAVHLRAPVGVRHGLAAGTLLCESRTVSSVRGNWLLGLDGVSALDEFRDAAGALWDDEHRAMRSVLVALPGWPGSDPDPGVVRPVVGIDLEQGAIALAEPVSVGSRVAFARRDSVAALAALSRAAEGLGAEPDGGGLGLAATCRARGEELFGDAGIESAYLARAFHPDPWLGLVGSYQIGAAAGATPSLLTNATAFAHLS